MSSFPVCRTHTCTLSVSHLNSHSSLFTLACHVPPHSLIESSHYAARIHKSVPTGFVPVKGAWPGSRGRPGPMGNKRDGSGGTETEEEVREKEWERAVAFQEVEGYSHWTASDLDFVNVCIHAAALSHASVQTAQDVVAALAQTQRSVREWKYRGEVTDECKCCS